MFAVPLLAFHLLAGCFSLRLDMLAVLEFPFICSIIICLIQDAQGALASLSLA